MNLQEAQEKHNVASMKAIEIIQQYQAGLILLDEFVAAIAKLELPPTDIVGVVDLATGLRMGVSTY